MLHSCKVIDFFWNCINMCLMYVLRRAEYRRILGPMNPFSQNQDHKRLLEAVGFRKKVDASSCLLVCGVSKDVQLFLFVALHGNCTIAHVSAL